MIRIMFSPLLAIFSFSRLDRVVVRSNKLFLFFFAYLRYLLSLDDLLRLESACWKDNGEFIEFLACLITLDYFFRISRITFAIWRTNQRDASARRVETSTNIEDCVHRSKLRSNRSPSAPLWAISASSCSINTYELFPEPLLSDPKLVWKLSERAFSAAFVMQACIRSKYKRSAFFPHHYPMLAMIV